jgi:hypothetical protein
MQEELRFPEQYKRLIDGNLDPEPERNADLLKTIQLQSVPHDSTETPCRSGGTAQN